MDETHCQTVARYLSPKSSDGLNLLAPPRRRGGGDATGRRAGWDEKEVVELEVLDRFFERSSELVAIGTYDGLILKVNAAWQGTLGYAAEELALTSLWDRVHPEALGIARTATRVLVRGGVVEVEVRMRHKDGGDRSISWSVVGVAGRFFAVGRDLTEQWRLETALAKAQEAAAAAHRAKSEFLAAMSHEIRTPMTAILGFADLLAERWRQSSQSTPEELEALETIKRNGDLLLGLINDILDLAKIEADRTQVALAPCSPAQLVADVMGLMHVRAEAQGLSLDVEFLTPIPKTINTDATRLRQILVNLIGNAIKFTDRGGARLRVRLVQGSDRNGGAGSGNGVQEGVLQFEVLDTGIGIGDEDIARLFQPFYRVDASPTRRHGGTGLGLALSLRLADRLGGTITARRRREGGSAFTLTIPAGPGGMLTVAPAASASADVPVPSCVTPAAPTTPALDPKPTVRVLLAEDNRDTQRVMTLRLAAAGFAVTPAPHGQAAVDLALAAETEGRPFDVVLMDMQMPVLDGYEATRTLRGEGYRRPIIAVTAHALAEDREECLRFGCDDYLAKPIDWPRLTSLIAAYSNHINIFK